jgi:hypothetical protein
VRSLNDESSIRKSPSESVDTVNGPMVVETVCCLSMFFLRSVLKFPSEARDLYELLKESLQPTDLFAKVPHAEAGLH